MIEVEGLTKSYGAFHAINGVSFKIDKGEIVGFLGPNGAGKTTTMRVLTAYHPATSGSARVAGFDVHTHPLEVKRNVGYLPESVPLYLEMQVRKYLRYVANIKGLSKTERNHEVDRVMERTGLEDMAGRIIRNLSKGYRQRVGLAQALIGSPPVLVLDEPTVGLDPKQIVSIRQTIKDLAHDHTVLLSTHILPEVSMICRRVLILHRGRIVAEDTPENLDSQHTLLLQAEGSSERVRELLSLVDGVTGVQETSSGHYTLNVTDDTISGQVSKALAGAGMTLTGLTAQQRSLEDLFIDVISRDEGNAA
ncbi:MAG: MFS transporter [Candidatus Hydrogenedentota bacterium]|nr:MAG: MFS transporter [Candidatus Hydrogenedentota bacterium]